MHYTTASVGYAEWMRAGAVRYWADECPESRDALGGGEEPPPGRPAYAQPLSPQRQVPASTAFNDSNRPQPLWQSPPTACLTASGAASEVPSLPMHPCPRGKALALSGRVQLSRVGKSHACMATAIPCCAPFHIWR